MPSNERITGVVREVLPATNPGVKETRTPINKNISEIVNTPKVVTPVSWDSGCRL